ncbi:hypothetical protein LOAG_09021 [Loa loa]|nr:hypothetical protein LOAG_09021 [Loa loa]EFO19470.1 hypothetical protein LOAG_09021 [Loa loa]
MNSYQKAVKSLNELGKLLHDEHSCISKPSTSSTSARDTQSIINDSALSINQIFDDILMEDEKKSRIKLCQKESIDILSNVNHNLSNVKQTTSNLLSNDTNRINQYDKRSMRMTQSAVGTDTTSNFRNKFSKLQLKTNFECHDYDEKTSCKKIELKKYIEFDTSSFWNKK